MKPEGGAELCTESEWGATLIVRTEGLSNTLWKARGGAMLITKPKWGATLSVEQGGGGSNILSDEGRQRDLRDGARRWSDVLIRAGRQSDI